MKHSKIVNRLRAETGFVQVPASVIIMIALVLAGTGMLAGSAIKPYFDAKQRQHREAGLGFDQGYVGVGVVPHEPPPPAVEAPAPAPTPEPTPKVIRKTVRKPVYVTPKPQPQPEYTQPRPPVIIWNTPPNHGGHESGSGGGYGGGGGGSGSGGGYGH